MKAIKITVLKRSLNEELAKTYVDIPVAQCPVFSDGQEFIVSSPVDKPGGFCEWAWNDTYKSLITLIRGGNFSADMFEGWMKNDRTMVTCCTDGIRPVIFHLERIDAEA